MLIHNHTPVGCAVCVNNFFLNRDCIDVSTQILATQSILKKVNIDILTNHLSHCLKETFESDDELAKQAKLKEVTDLLNKILK